MKHLGLDLRVIHKLHDNHRRLRNVEQGLKKKEENALIYFQQLHGNST